MSTHLLFRSSKVRSQQLRTRHSHPMTERWFLANPVLLVPSPLGPQKQVYRREPLSSRVTVSGLGRSREGWSSPCGGSTDTGDRSSDTNCTAVVCVSVILVCVGALVQEPSVATPRQSCCTSTIRRWFDESLYSSRLYLLGNRVEEEWHGNVLIDADDIVGRAISWSSFTQPSNQVKEHVNA